MRCLRSKHRFLCRTWKQCLGVHCGRRLASELERQHDIALEEQKTIALRYASDHCPPRWYHFPSQLSGCSWAKEISSCMCS